MKFGRGRGAISRVAWFSSASARWEARPDETLSLSAALDDGIPSSDGRFDALARRVMADRIAPRALVSEDGRAFAVNVALESRAGDRYREILVRIDEAVGDAAVVRSGVPVTRLEVGQRTQDDLLRFQKADPLGFITSFSQGSTTVIGPRSSSCGTS